MHRQRGFSYVVVMFLVAVLSITAVRAIENTLTNERRQLEEELLWRGSAYRAAIRQYYHESLGTAKEYPETIDDLLYDDRLVRPTRPLRRHYRDPMTADGKWGVVKNAKDQVIGVYSRSQVKPLKREGFPAELGTFANAARYSDWKFIYQPEQEVP